VRLPLNVPIDIGRDTAAAAARTELSKPVYAQGRPSVEQRVIAWLVGKVAQAIGTLASVAFGSLLGVIVLVALLALVVVVILRRTGPMRRSMREETTLFVGLARSAAQYRADADAAAAAGNWDEAVRQRFRALVRSLEERDILDARPGRTADEAATDAARALPSCAVGLRAAARSFDDVAYGARARDQHADAALRELDRQLAAARPVQEPHDLPAALAPAR
jgi:Domain of unknown function (DUF4129)